MRVEKNVFACRIILGKSRIPVGHIEDFVAVRVVTGPVGISADPLKQFVISDNGDEVKTASSDSRVLVSAETTHVHRSIVQQETRVRPCERSDADRQSIDVRFGGSIRHRQSYLKRWFSITSNLYTN